MRKRSDLRDIFYGIAGEDHVYYDPPANVHMKYPCIRYERSNMKDQYADNLKYLSWTRYEVIVMDKNPDSPLAEQVSQLPYCSYVNKYVAENIHHTIFQIFF